MKRTIGVAVLLLSVTLVFVPLPLSDVVPALVIALLSLAYLEEDGALLLIALLTAVITLSTAAAATWSMSRTRWNIDPNKQESGLAHAIVADET